MHDAVVAVKGEEKKVKSGEKQFLTCRLNFEALLSKIFPRE